MEYKKLEDKMKRIALKQIYKDLKKNIGKEISLTTDDGKTEYGLLQQVVKCKNRTGFNLTIKRIDGKEEQKDKSKHIEIRGIK